MGLEINRDKTKIIKLKFPSSSFDFLGFTFRFDKSRIERETKYLNMFPSKKSLRKEREVLKDMTSSRYSFVPIPELIKRLNRNLLGWSNYFDFGYPRKAFNKINWYILNRLYFHLNRRGQRRFKWPKDITVYRFFKLLGLMSL